MKIESKKDDRGQFAVYVDDEKTDHGCEKCKHYNEKGDCDMAKLEDGSYRSDDKMYLFCGKVCGYFSII